MYCSIAFFPLPRRPNPDFLVLKEVDKAVENRVAPPIDE